MDTKMDIIYGIVFIYFTAQLIRGIVKRRPYTVVVSLIGGICCLISFVAMSFDDDTIITILGIWEYLVTLRFAFYMLDFDDYRSFYRALEKNKIYLYHWWINWIILILLTLFCIEHIFLLK